MTPRKRNKKGEGAMLRNELIDAAMRILDRAPATVLSLRMVAREAGVAAPSVYPHFTDGQAMMSEIVRECWRQMAAAMALAADQVDDGDAFARLKAKMGAFVQYAMERPSRYQLLFAMQPLDPEDPGQMDGYIRPVYRQVTDTLEDHVREGGVLPADDLLESALMVISLAHGRIALAHLAPIREGNSPPHVEAFVLDMLDRIFRTQEPKTPRSKHPRTRKAAKVCS